MRKKEQPEDEALSSVPFLHALPHPLFAIDRNHRVILWNEAMEGLTGIPAGQVLGTDDHSLPFYSFRRPTLADLVLDDGESDVVSKLYRHCARTDGGWSAEQWFPHLNGRERYLSFEAKRVHDRDGDVIAALEIIQDITERRRNEESLHLFRTVVEQSASAIVITDPLGTIEYVNDAFVSITGYSRDEVLGQNPRILKSGRQGPEVYEDLWKTITSGKQWHGEFHNRRKDGTLYWENVTISPISDSRGNITHFLAIKDDITGRKELEYQLRKQQAELVVKHEQLSVLFAQVATAKNEWETTMDCIDDFLILTDTENRIKRCNRPLLAFTGKTFSDLIGHDWREVFSADFLDQAEIDAAANGAVDLHHEASDRWFLLRIYHYGSGDGWVITLHDQTVIKRMTTELNAAYEQLKQTHMQLLQQEKLASIGQLAAGVAHEINNPMGFITSNLSTMKKYADRLSQYIDRCDEMLRNNQELSQLRRALKIDHVLDDIPKLLAESTDGAERVRTIVQNLKSFSRVDQSEILMANLNDCLESTLTIAWNELKYTCTVEREYDPELPPIPCHPQQLNQVFLNLLVNAAHAIEKSGVISVRTWHDDDRVHVSVSDTGKGIPPEIINRIFEPFFTTKEPGKGTGLGLSISYDIVTKHGGTIEVESTPGVGTTFTIHLPRKGNHVAATDTNSEESHG